MKAILIVLFTLFIFLINAAQVFSVCAKKSYWIELKNDKEFEKMRVKVKDGANVFQIKNKEKIF